MPSNHFNTKFEVNHFQELLLILDQIIKTPCFLWSVILYVYVIGGHALYADILSKQKNIKNKGNKNLIVISRAFYSFVHRFM